MSSASIALVVFACVFGGALIGLSLRTGLSADHLSDATKDVVKLVTGLIATLAALVLGLLVASAKNSFDTVNEGFRQSAAKIVLLDRALAQYGPETKDLRETLKAALSARIGQFAKKDRSASLALKSSQATEAMELFQQRIRSLAPQNDVQRTMQSKALELAEGVSQARWMGIENEDNTIPTPFLVVMVFWLSAMFLSFGLFAPRNAITVIALLLGAMSLSAAIYLIEALYSPLEGFIAVSTTPLETALAQLGR
jgi:hypothetical protein